MSVATAAERARSRETQRRQSAALRAVGEEPHAELRGGRVVVDGRRSQVASPYLTVTGEERGVADALAMLLRFSDEDVHVELRPDHPLERVIFDFCEQLRCEALVPASLPGVRRNIDRAFRSWCAGVRGQRIGENGLGLLVYTVTHMVRARLVEVIFDEEVDALTEITRGNLSTLVGHALRELRPHLADQRRFGAAALEIARLTLEMAGDTSADDGADEEAEARQRLLILAEWDDGELEGEVVGEGVAGAAPGRVEGLDEIGGYHVFTRAYDREVSGRDLYRPDVRVGLRRDLDAQIRAQAVSPFRLARRLHEILATPTPQGWEDNHELGALDTRRLAQIVSMPANPNVYRQVAHRREVDAAVTFLVDTSGSMKLQRYEAVAVLVDTFTRALDLAGAAVEVLGFTTNAWAGGRAATDATRAGASVDPGRLNELLHVVYKDADEPWRQSRSAIASMMRTDHYREGIDGEALIWAYRRLRSRSEQHRVLVVISDGAPMDAATARANGTDFLLRHLAGVAAAVDADPNVTLGAIGVDLALDDIYARSVDLDLSGTLQLGTYEAVEELLRP